ncbi:rhodanese-like domain-containing protein [Xylophilus sp.]|uniref:rhodanese-like domain-containing protein n=1 Tax=Xylophilus sp. TaxID=2653893 RepID=UPI0013B903AA|nr:rhodanese-like domain-containing protein [Xylophilus sp.]KAF1048793.1 MAG: Sulfurtransferase [Xylophilus sp.]
MTVAQIRPAEIDAWLAEHRTADGRVPLLIDVREPWELQTASVQPAAEAFELAAIPMNDIPARLGELDADRPVAVLCHHGARSQRVALFLDANGFAEVANVAGGIDAWSAERDPGVPRY